MNSKMFIDLTNTPATELKPIDTSFHGKIYADVPLNYFSDIDELKKYVLELKNMGVNVLLIMPHFLPSFSAYVAKDYEQPCRLFNNWETFSEFMLYVKNLGLDRMIDIPLNHADWNVNHLKREWFIEHQTNGVEAGANDVDADNKKVRINWGAYILDNSLKELQDYWLNKVIFPHIENYNVNAIRIDAAWALDPIGLQRLISETKAKFPHVWFVAENLGMARLIKLAESGIKAGADRFFNSFYWYVNGSYGISDVYEFYKSSNGVPTCSIYSSHDVLMPSMKALAKLRPQEIKGLNDKGIVRKFVEYDNISSINQLSPKEQSKVVTQMKLDFALFTLMASDLMFVAGSEKCLFKRVDVVKSRPEDFKLGIESDFPDFIKQILQIKFSHKSFNLEGLVIPFGNWQPDKLGLKAFVKTQKNGSNILVLANTNVDETIVVKSPRRVKAQKFITFYTSAGSNKTKNTFDSFTLNAGQLLIAISED